MQGTYRSKVLRFDGASPSTERSALQALCEAFGSVRYVDFKFGNTAGYVRFVTADGAQAAAAGLVGMGYTVGDAQPTWTLLGEVEAEQYFQEVSRKRAAGPAGALGGAGFGGVANPASVPEQGCVVRFEGASPSTERSALTALCETHAQVAFVDFKFGDSGGYVRFRSADGAKAAAAALGTAGAVVAGATPSWRLLTDAESEAYYQGVQAKKRQRDDGAHHAAWGRGHGAPHHHHHHHPGHPSHYGPPGHHPGIPPYGPPPPGRGAYGRGRGAPVGPYGGKAPRY